uniref:DDE Tnp4 domain-containing protein n=1 Tax=Knipowitschia caucasica TaxID=637954 RepID=A0AAV2J2H3_KNICA
MKTRFRAIFFHTLEVHHTFAPNVIAACAVLHNICLGVGDVVAPEDSPEDSPEEDEGEEDTVSAAQWRDRLSAEMSALEEVQMDHEYL